MTRFVSSACLVILASVALAVDPTGKWAGRLIKGPDVQPGISPTLQSAETTSFKQDFSKAKYSLELKADHTFSRTLKRGKFSSVSTGTWSVNGLSVVLVTVAIGSAKIKPQSSQFAFSADGKTLTYRQPNGVTLQYKRA